MLNIVSLIVGGAGIFVVLTKFNVPELNMSFFGENPFAVKRDAIETVMTWIFTCLATIGLLLQIGGEIWSDRLQSRQYTSSFYMCFFLVSCLMAFVIVCGLTAIGNRIAKRTWLPMVVAKQAELYSQTRIIVDHDGWEEGQLKVKDTLQNPRMYQEKNLEGAERSVTQIERLLDLPSDLVELKPRMERLAPFFERL